MKSVTIQTFLKIGIVFIPNEFFQNGVHLFDTKFIIFNRCSFFFLQKDAKQDESETYHK